MDVKTCRVHVADVNGVTDTAEVTATSLYEAIALGLAAMRSNDWAAELVRGNPVKVRQRRVGDGE